ncbi:hypothetical protein SAMN05518861_1548 [Mesorhizobium sp. YR577]|nr:hypothetical protein SAMN05518861_1548 [Mesorhizobium sp. YR577]
MSPRKPLDRAIVEAFKTATNADRPDVAEHLLRALECLCGGPESGGANEAYKIICDQVNCECESFSVQGCGSRTKAIH